MTVTYPSGLLYPGAEVYPADGSQLAIPDPETVAALLSGSRVDLFEAVIEQGGDRMVLDVTDGSTTEDPAASPQITLSTSLISEELSPLEAEDILHPDAGAIITIRCGVTSRGTGDVWFTQGSFAPVDVSADYGTEGTRIDLIGHDELNARTRGRRLPKKVQLYKGQDVEAAAFQILADRDPSLRFEFGHTPGKVTARIVVGPEGEDPVKAVDDMLAKPAGARIVQGADRVVRMMPITDPLTATPKASWTTGSASVIQSLKLRATKSPDAICGAWQGGFLVIPEDKGWIIPFDGDTSTFDTEDKARTAMEAQLALKRGAGREVEVQAWADYSLHAGDVVNLTAVGLAFKARIARRELNFRSPISPVKLVDRKEVLSD